MRALIVGAGAVGLVYGQALQRAGVEVVYFVRPKYAEEAKAGFAMYALNSRTPTVPQQFSGFGVVTSAEEVRGSAWDQVWLAVSSTAVRGEWLPDVLAATGDATVVCLQPGPEGKQRVAPLAKDRLVVGIIAFIAYQAPLPHETRFPTPGLAYWFPPSGSPFHGPPARVGPVVDALNRGGCPAKVSGPLDVQATFGSALLQVHVGALDSVGWSWRDARSGDHLDLAARAWREAAAIGAHDLGVRAPWWRGLVRPGLARVAMWLAPKVIPIDVETYFGYHFTKVGDQTRATLDHWIGSGRAAGLPVDALVEQRRRLGDHAVFKD